MAASRKRRFVKRVAVALAGVVLLPVWYVAAWLAVSRAEHDGHIGSATVQRVRPAFIPLVRYCESDLPGSGAIGEMWWSVNPPVILKVTTNGLEYKFATTTQLAPPTTARVDEILKAEFSEGNWRDTLMTPLP